MSKKKNLSPDGALQCKEQDVLDATLVLLVRDGKVALAKKLQKIGVGRYNGYGGKIEKGETPEQAALRELRQESGVIGREIDLRKGALITFHTRNEDGTRFTCHVYVYLLGIWRGEPKVKEKKKMGPPKWFSCTKLPLRRMMPADAVWMPHVLDNRKIKAEFTYGPKQKFLIRSFRVEFVDRLDKPFEKGDG